MKKVVSLIFLLLVGLSVFAQQTDEKEKERIEAIKSAIGKKDNQVIAAVTMENKVAVFWSFAELNTTVNSINVWYYRDEQLYSEYYLVENEKLIYAFEQELFIPLNHTPQRVWNCDYYLKKNHVFYHISLGHGKTEDDSWLPDDIVAQFQKRMKERAGIKENYNPE